MIRYFEMVTGVLTYNCILNLNAIIILCSEYKFEQRSKFKCSHLHIFLLIIFTVLSLISYSIELGDSQNYMRLITYIGERHLPIKPLQKTFRE